MGPTTGLDRCGKSRHPPGFDPRTVQPVARVSKYKRLFIKSFFIRDSLSPTPEDGIAVG